MERGGGSNLLAPTVKEEVHHGEKHGEEKAIDDVMWECEGVGGFCLVMVFKEFAGVMLF